MDKAELILLQHREAKGENPLITCGCSHPVPLRFMYRCYYCKQYYCESCAPHHFGKTRDEYYFGAGMKKGDPVIVTIEGRRLVGTVELVSNNGRSIAIFFDEGIPAPFALHNCGKQCLLLSKLEDGSYLDILGDRPVRISQ